MRKAMLGLLALAALPSTALARRARVLLVHDAARREHYYYVYAAFFIAVFLLAASLPWSSGKKTEEW